MKRVVAFALLLFSILIWSSCESRYDDYGPLEVVSTYPENYSTDIPYDAEIVIEFNKPIMKDVTGIRSVGGDYPRIVYCDVEYLDDRTIVFIPRYYLAKNSNYIFSFHDIKGEDESEIEYGGVIHFTTSQ